MVSENVESRYRQYRVRLDDGGIIQLTEPIEQHKTCSLYLGYWSDGKGKHNVMCVGKQGRGDMRSSTRFEIGPAMNTISMFVYVVYLWRSTRK